MTGTLATSRVMREMKARRGVERMAWFLGLPVVGIEGPPRL